MATSSVICRHKRPGSASVDLSCVSSHCGSVGSTALSRDSRTNSRSGLRLEANESEAPMTQRSMFFISSLRAAAGRNSDGSTSLPWASSMRIATSKIFWSPPDSEAIGCCTRRKRFSINAAFMCLTHTWS